MKTGDPLFDLVDDDLPAGARGNVDYWALWRLTDPVSIGEASRLLAGLSPTSTRVRDAMDGAANAYAAAMVRAVQSGRLHAASPLAWIPNGYDGEFVACDPADDALCEGTTVPVSELRRWADECGIAHRWPAAGNEGESRAPDLSRYPAEIRAAIEAFEAVSANPKATAGKSAKQALREWLAANKPELSGSAHDRIATVANWQQAGGAPKTPGE